MNTEWKWTKGEPYERSKRLTNTEYIENQQQFSQSMEKDAYTSSLHHDENTWDILNNSLAASGFTTSNKREELDYKIADRDLVQQRGFNPFLDNNNYVNDVTVRDQFLKPVNTTQDRIKMTNDENN